MHKKKFVLPPERDDVLKEGWAPKSYRKALYQMSPMNPYGEPKYRMVLCQYVFEWHGGEFWDWPEGADLHAQGGLSFSDKLVKRKYVVQPPDRRVAPQQITVEEPEGMKVSELQPLRKVVESRFVPRYPEIPDGWILMRWRPAEHWGPPQLWESLVHPGTDIQMLGPYPSRGRYEFAIESADEDGFHWRSWPNIPSIGCTEQTIQFLEQQDIERYGNTPRVRMAARGAEYEMQRRAAIRSMRDNRIAEVRDALRPYLSNTLGGQRLRNEVARRAGISSHVSI